MVRAARQCECALYFCTIHINMVTCVFYYVTSATLKKKDETNGGPWDVL